MQKIKSLEKSWSIPAVVGDGGVESFEATESSETTPVDPFVGEFILLPIDMERSDGGQSVRFRFRDVENGIEITLLPGEVVPLFTAIVDGDVDIVDGKLRGEFTFRKNGRAVSLAPISDEERRRLDL